MKTDCEISSTPLVSLIIRTKDEERWIGSCLRSVFNQTYKNFEVVIVDNCSKDQTLRRVKEFDVKVININDFLPGKAINAGIKASSGEYLVCLSGHCIPTSEYWLETLIKDLGNPKVAGVYGRQEPLSFTSDLDKRDLLTVFGLDKKIQNKDFFFHNANSAFRREIWLKYPFNEEVTNIEDRVWGREVISDGFKIIYEPEASVFHWHGINHDLNPERARKIVRILESLDDSSNTVNPIGVESMDIVAIIPIRGHSSLINGKQLLKYAIEATKKSSLIKRIIVSTDNQTTANLAISLGADAPFLRPKNLSYDYIDVKEVLSFTVDQIEHLYGVPDLVVSIDETYPFRPPTLLDSMIKHLVEDGLDTVIAAKPELRAIFVDKDGQVESLSEGFMPRELKNYRPMISLMGLGCVTHPSFIRSGEILGLRLGVFEVNDPMSAEQIRDSSGLKLAEDFLDTWWDKHYVKS